MVGVGANNGCEKVQDMEVGEGQGDENGVARDETEEGRD